MKHLKNCQLNLKLANPWTKSQLELLQNIQRSLSHQKKDEHISYHKAGIIRSSSQISPSNSKLQSRDDKPPQESLGLADEDDEEDQLSTPIKKPSGRLKQLKLETSDYLSDSSPETKPTNSPWFSNFLQNLDRTLNQDFYCQRFYSELSRRDESYILRFLQELDKFSLQLYAKEDSELQRGKLLNILATKFSNLKHSTNNNNNDQNNQINNNNNNQNNNKDNQNNNNNNDNNQKNNNNDNNQNNNNNDNNQKNNNNNDNQNNEIDHNNQIDNNNQNNNKIKNHTSSKNSETDFTPNGFTAKNENSSHLKKQHLPQKQDHHETEDPPEATSGSLQQLE